MEVREYLSIRRAYNAVRQQTDAANRLTFSEFAILCRLSLSTRQLRTSDIAEYQGCLRPTMTHRTKHLSELGLITRSKGDVDRRNVVCNLSEEGGRTVKELCEQTRQQVVAEKHSSRITVERVCRSIDVMGSVNYMARDLVLLALAEEKDGSSTVGDLVNGLGFLQPTISMSVSSLKEDGLVVRGSKEGAGETSYVIISDEGREEARRLAERIKVLNVGRARKK